MKYIFFLWLAMWCYAGGALAPDSHLHQAYLKPLEHKEGLAKSSLVNTITVSLGTLIEQIKEGEQPEQALKLLPYLLTYLLLIDNELPEYSRENSRIHEKIHHIVENSDALTDEEWLDFLRNFDLWDIEPDEAEEHTGGLANQTPTEQIINKPIHLSLFGGGGGAIAHIKQAGMPVEQLVNVLVEGGVRVLDNNASTPKKD